MYSTSVCRRGWSSQMYHKAALLNLWWESRSDECSVGGDIEVISPDIYLSEF